MADESLLEGSLFLQPSSDSSEGELEPSLDWSEFTPAAVGESLWGGLQGALNRDWGTALLGALGALPLVPSVTKIRPTVVKAYVPDLVQTAQRRIVEPVIPISSDAVKVTLSDDMRRILEGIYGTEPVTVVDILKKKTP